MTVEWEVIDFAGANKYFRHLICKDVCSDCGLMKVGRSCGHFCCCCCCCCCCDEIPLLSVVTTWVINKETKVLPFQVVLDSSGLLVIQLHTSSIGCRLWWMLPVTMGIALMAALRSALQSTGYKFGQSHQSKRWKSWDGRQEDESWNVLGSNPCKSVPFSATNVKLEWSV